MSGDRLFLVLRESGLIVRNRSEGDGRRTYLRLAPESLADLTLPLLWAARRVVFVCTHNSARSQLATALWTRQSAIPAESAGKQPARRVHPRAIRVARRHGLALGQARPVNEADVVRRDDLVVAVCDNAHERLGDASHRRLHWSVPDPARADTDEAFEAAYADLAGRVDGSLPSSPRSLTMTEATAYQRDDLSVDQQVALNTAALRLRREFDGVYGAETIERFLHTSYEQFASHSTVPHFLPLLAERFARHRLVAQARIEGLRHDGRPIVLFLCVHNAGRSQMALGFLTHLAGDRAIGWSGGQEPGTEINPAALAAMAERGIDITGEYPKPWTDEVVQAADVVITMGCGDACPIFPGKRYEDWTLEDPAGKTVDEVRPIRDEIEHRVRHLLDELGVPAMP